MSTKLTDKQKIFCKEYIKDFNATRAAIAAGYSKKTAYATGAENLRKPQLQKKINEMKAKRAERTQITADNVVKELAKIGFGSEDQIEGFTRLEIKDKIKALELLARHTGAFNNDESTKAMINVIMGTKTK